MCIRVCESEVDNGSDDEQMHEDSQGDHMTHVWISMPVARVYHTD